MNYVGRGCAETFCLINDDKNCHWLVRSKNANLESIETLHKLFNLSVDLLRQVKTEGSSILFRWFLCEKLKSSENASKLLNFLKYDISLYRKQNSFLASLWEKDLEHCRLLNISTQCSIVFFYHKYFKAIIWMIVHI